MKRHKLDVEKREILGKKVKELRREGLIPANIYGKDVKSVAVQLKDKEFEKIFAEVGETGLIDLSFDSQTRPVLIHNVQYNSISRKPIHADFYQVNLKEKVKTAVPLELVGEAKAVVDKIGILLQQLTEVEVEALPADLPEKIEVNVESLTNIDDQIMVSGLKLPEGVTVLNDPEQTVVRVSELVSKEAEEEAAKEAEAKAAAEAEAETEGTTPTGEPQVAAETPQEEQK